MILGEWGSRNEIWVLQEALRLAEDEMSRSGVPGVLRLKQFVVEWKTGFQCRITELHDPLRVVV